ncbi:MAG: sugar transferase [Clostridia bacterium]|nr:sugar transferase [Clostridia bacterium]
MNPKTAKRVKRVFDLGTALVGGAVSAPVLLGAMAVVRLRSPEDPVIFRQTRTGYHGAPFTMYKLRSMTNERDAQGNLLPDAQRLKSWGKVMRKLSIDELPQILNIVKGEMSWVGPRPLLPEEMNVMTPAEQAERQSVLPGVTGWEAVNEALSDSRRRMAEFDLEYVRNWSLGFDLKILLRTAAILAGVRRAPDELRAPALKAEELRQEAAQQIEKEEEKV